MAEQRNTAAGTRPRPGPARAPASSGFELTPRDIISMLRRHLWLIILLTALGLSSGVGGWYLMRKYNPKYTAQGLIRVLSPVEKDPMQITTPFVQKDIMFAHRASMAALIKRLGMLQELVKMDKVKQTKWYKSFGDIEDEAMVKAVGDLMYALKAVPSKDNEFVVVSMTCGDAEEAALIVNEMMDLFVASQTTGTQGDVADRLRELRQQEDRLTREWRDTIAAMNRIRSETGFAELKDQNFMDTITRTLANLEGQQDRLELDIKRAQQIRENLQRQATGVINEQVANLVEGDPTMVMLTQQLAAQQSQLAALLEKFGESHRSVQQLRGLIEKTKERRQARRAEIAEQVRRANLQNAEDQLAVLTANLEKLQAMVDNARAQKQQLEQARADYETKRSIRDERKQRLDEVRTQIEKLRIMYRDPETPKVRVAARAVPPLDISSPKAIVYVPGGTMLGFMLGAALAFLLELLNDLVRTPRDVIRHLRVPLLGVIPDASEDSQVKGLDLCHVVRDAPHSVISESYRRLRTNLTLSPVSADSPKVIFVTSGTAGEGKTSVAINLATSFVADNKKVLLVDANFWRSMLHRVFPRAGSEPRCDETIQSDFGLTTFLQGQCEHLDIIRSSGVENFDIVDSGPLPANPPELLGSTRMKQFIEARRSEYDYVIIDGPPVLLVSDAKILAKLADGTVLVCNAGIARRGAAQRTIRELALVNAGIIGCVLFGAKSLKGGYFQEQFRSYQEYRSLQLAQVG